MSATTILARPSEPAQHRDQDRLCVLIADHDGLARCMMRTALNNTDRISIVLSASDAHEAIELAGYYHPTVMIIDLGLPSTDPGTIITNVQAGSPHTKIVTMSADDDDQPVLTALRAGAVGHISKDTEPDQLADQVLQIADGDAIIPQRLIKPLLEIVRDAPDTGWRPLHSRLTCREWEMIDLLAADTTTQQIADQLVLSADTVYSHIKSVLRKLGVHSRQEAIIAAETLRHEEATTTGLGLS
jgi:two-component system nitrate/nitrite response regulator NarL